jgi:hypothetical protein
MVDHHFEWQPLHARDGIRTMTPEQSEFEYALSLRNAAPHAVSAVLIRSPLPRGQAI